MIGASPAFERARRLIHRAAQWDAIVFLQGETGTGKELAAHAIHYLSARRGAPFLPLNCGGLPDTLLESELFGHVRGAFTDAREAKPGLISEAEGGTLFLDEVDALSSRAQVTLLRFLQDGVYRPLGATASRRGNVRVIAASNADLGELCAQRTFRVDLYYRLCVLKIELPPLRERGDDVHLLADFFLHRLAQSYGMSERRLDMCSQSWLGEYRWPGNVRELENLLHREFLFGEGPEVRVPEAEAAHAARLCAACAPEPAGRFSERFSERFSAAKANAVRSFERGYLTWALSEAHGNVSAAARRSGKERRSFGKLLKKHGIDPTTYR